MMQSQELEISIEELATEVSNLLESEQSDILIEKLNSLHPSTLSDLLLNVSAIVRDQLLQHITGLDSIADLVAHAPVQLREQLLVILDDTRLAAVIRRLDLDDAADVLSSIPRRRQVKILKRLNPSLVKELTTLLAYDAQTAGGIMNPRFFSLSPDESAGDAVNRLKSALSLKTIDDDTDLSNCFVLDPQGRLIGVTSLRELLAAPEFASIQSIMTPEVISINAESDQIEAAWKIADYDISSLPVISDENGTLVGIVTV